MLWVIGIFNRDENKFQLVETHTDIDADDPKYGDEIHIVPCTETETEYKFGYHTFKKDCVCHPKIERNDSGRKVKITHSERVN